MRTITSTSGKAVSVNVRRTESSDAHQITELISPATVAVFGEVNVIYLLEKANLAVTICTIENKVLAHAAFLDHPFGDLVDQASWERLLHTQFNATRFTPLNNLFLHLFVAQPGFSTSSAKEIIRTVFNAITELEYICLVTPYSSSLEPALLSIFEPMPCVKEGVQCAAFVCYRHSYCPRLHVRRARLEDHDDLTLILTEQTKSLADCYGPYFLSELIEAQDETNHIAVCENEGRAVGCISVTGEIKLQTLNQFFQLGPFDGLRKPNAENHLQDSDPSESITPLEQTTESQSEVQERLYSSHLMPCGGSAEPPNAFSIQLFAIDKKFEMRSVDFLPYIFKLFPERDFCIISVPKLAPEFPLLQHFNRVVPCDCSNLPQELYIFHRSGLLKSIEVRVAVSDDIAAVQRLVQKLDLHEALMQDMDMFLKSGQDSDGTCIQVFVAQVEGQVVGVIVIRNEQDIEYIRAHYNIENFVYFSQHQCGEHGQLRHFVLNPIFQHYSKHFLKEALRLAHKSCLYYHVYPPYHFPQNSFANAPSLTSVLICMVPVLPRRQIIYPLEDLGVNAPSELITNEQAPYALNHVNRKLTMEPKVTINARIVVVGASDTGIAFLEAFVFCPHLRFNNLTLVSPLGLPGGQNHDSMRFLATSHGYSQRDHAQISLRTWVNVVIGKMMAIDREAKHIQVTGGHIVPYDHLILCTGQQYQVPCLTGIDVKGSSTGPVPEQNRRRYAGHVPSNLFTLNNQQDCTQAHDWLNDNLVHQEGNAVVYGDTLDVYTCVETLLHLGVRGSRIHLVHQTKPGSQSCFQNCTIDQAVRTVLENQDINVHHNCILAELNDGEHLKPLTSVCFTTAGLPLRLECAVFFNFSCKGVDYDAFKAINDACLVFDGRLVIDSTFHTNDCTIRAAGPLTKFARRYHADQWSHSNFNSKEVGRDLAAKLLPLFDPVLDPLARPAPDEDRLIPVYKEPKITGGRLPGGYNYLHVTKPSVNSNRAPGREIMTGGTETGNYFQLQFSQHGVVESITCLCSKPLPVSNYLCLYGKHQLLLNRLYECLEDGLVQDFYSYFRERWCMAIFHDRFADFEQEVRRIMESAKVQLGTDSVPISTLAEMAADGMLEINEDPGVYLNEMFGKSEDLATLKMSLLDYLQFNRYHLTMYAQPRKLD